MGLGIACSERSAGTPVGRVGWNVGYLSHHSGEVMKPMAKLSLSVACLMAVLLICETAPEAAPDPSLTSRAIQLVNAARQQNGLPPLVLNEKLMRAAQALADDIARRRVIAHTDAAGKGLGERFLAVDYVYSLADEAVTVGESTPEAAVGDLLSQPGNRDNLLNADVRDVGVGIAAPRDRSASGGTGTYWVIDLGLRVERGPGP